MKILRKFNKKKIVAVCIAIFSLSIVGGCSAPSKVSAKNPTVKEISEKVKPIADSASMKVGDGDKLKKLYGISADEVEEFAIYTASTNVKADEIAILKVKESNNVNGIKEKIEKRVEKQKVSFKDYLPEEVFLLDKNVIKVNGNYILFVILKDADKVESTFDGFFK